MNDFDLTIQSDEFARELTPAELAELWGDDPEEDSEPRDAWTDADYDADTLASAGWGTDEDYGYYGE